LLYIVDTVNVILASFTIQIKDEGRHGRRFEISSRIFGGVRVAQPFSFLCCVFFLFLSSSCVLCTQCYQCILIVHS